VVDKLDGSSVDIADYYGRHPVVLEFWATWCPLCRKLEPSMQAAREKYAGKVTFVSVGVAANQSAEKQKAYVDDKKLTGVFTFDRAGTAMKAFAVPHTSYIVVVGPDRRVAYTGVGDDQDIDAVLSKLGTH
jgi:thiol-disulfide isomerase/thioredoxin